MVSTFLTIIKVFVKQVNLFCRPSHHRVLLVLSVVLAAMARLAADPVNCADSTGSQKYLTGEVSPGTLESPTVVLFPCDTMIVPVGVGYSVGKNTYLAFKNPKPSNLIVVAGVMKISGDLTDIVHISSSLDTVSLSNHSMKGPWQGLRVDSEALLFLNHVSMYGADVPISSTSENINIKDARFFDAEYLHLPRQTKYRFLSSYYVDSFKFREYYESEKKKKGNAISKKNAPHSPHQADSAKRRSVWAKPWAWVGVGVAILGGATVFWSSRAGDPDPIKVQVQAEFR